MKRSKTPAPRPGSGTLERGKSGASYPTLAEAKIDRRDFLAGLGAVTLVACFYESPEDGVAPPIDAGIALDGTSPVADAGWELDGTPSPPDAGVDAVPSDALFDAPVADAEPADGPAKSDPDDGDP